jgi:hypothetical protein
LLVRFDRAPGVLAWLGMVATGAAGWFAHPLLFSLCVPLFLIYYLGAGVRHASPGWHVALWLGQLTALGANGLWVYDWVIHWWIRAPLAQSEELLADRTLRNIWNAPLWGEAEHRALAVFLLCAGLVGVTVFNQQGQRNAARLLGLGGAALLALALLGVCWELAGQVGTSVLLTPALCFAAVAAAHALAGVLNLSRRLIARPWPRRVVLAMLALAAVVPASPHLALLARGYCRAEPLEIGLGAERQQLVETLTAQTDPRARILWEDRDGGQHTSRWTALLPLLTGRNFIGGLDPAGCIEHSHVGFVRREMAGKPIGSWSDAGLARYCERYNVGAAVVWTPDAIERFRKWESGARLAGGVSDGGDGYLFRIERTTPSYALKGRATVHSIDNQRLVLTDVYPRDGQVVLSLHYHSGLRASPSRVKIEPEKNVHDRVPLVRLRVAGPVSRLTLTWEAE